MSHQLEGYVSDDSYTFKGINALINDSCRSLEIDEKLLCHTVDFTRFTSPTIQYYCKCHICGGKGCELCEEKGTICFAAAGVESESGDETKRKIQLSFCLSVDRLAMIKYKYNDMRRLYEG